MDIGLGSSFEFDFPNDISVGDQAKASPFIQIRLFSPK